MDRWRGISVRNFRWSVLAVEGTNDEEGCIAVERDYEVYVELNWGFWDGRDEMRCQLIP